MGMTVSDNQIYLLLLLFNQLQIIGMRQNENFDEILIFYWKKMYSTIFFSNQLSAIVICILHIALRVVYLQATSKFRRVSTNCLQDEFTLITNHLQIEHRSKYLSCNLIGHYWNRRPNKRSSHKATTDKRRNWNSKNCFDNITARIWCLQVIGEGVEYFSRNYVEVSILWNIEKCDFNKNFFTNLLVLLLDHFIFNLL